MDEVLLHQIHPVMKAIRKYHRHEVVGMENIPEHGRMLVAVNHSLATYDIGLLFTAIFEEKNRIARPLADNLFFKSGLGSLVEAFGAKRGTPENAKALLEAEELVGVAPGGMHEALRPSSERYQTMWEKRRGFIKLAVQTNTPIVLGACPKADDIFSVYDNPITSWAYRKFKVPLFLARGVGLTLLPKPVKLIHFLSEPLIPPAFSSDNEIFERRVNTFHKKIIKRMDLLMGEAIAYKV